MWHFFYFIKNLIFLTVAGVKEEKIAQNEKNNYIFQTPYLEELYIIWSLFLVHLCKMISPFFFIFLKKVICKKNKANWHQRVKGQKWPKMKNNYIRYVLYLRNSIAYDHDIWYTCVKWWYLVFLFCFFFHFLKILIFGVVRGLKGQRTVQNDKKYCLFHAASEIPYIVWLSFMVNICKMIIC